MNNSYASVPRIHGGLSIPTPVGMDGVPMKSQRSLRRREIYDRDFRPDFKRPAARPLCQRLDVSVFTDLSVHQTSTKLSLFEDNCGLIATPVFNGYSEQPAALDSGHFATRQFCHEAETGISPRSLANLVFLQGTIRGAKLLFCRLVITAGDSAPLRFRCLTTDRDCLATDRDTGRRWQQTDMSALCTPPKFQGTVAPFSCHTPPFLYVLITGYLYRSIIA